MRYLKSSFVAAFLSCAFALPARADAPRVSYELSIPDPAAHVFHVAMRAEGLDRPTTVVRMPIWIPGFYSDEQYGRNVMRFSAVGPNGEPIAFARDGQSAYRLATQGKSAVRIDYDLFADRRADVGTQLTTERALFNGAETFMYLQNDDGYPAPGAVELAIHAPTGWTTESGLLAMRSGTATYTAPSYDVLVDCPTLIAPHLEVASFTINAVPYHVVIDGPGAYDVRKVAATIEPIIAVQVKLMGHAGYKEYWVLLLSGSGGGMEHLNSTLSGISAYGWERPHDRDDGSFHGSQWNYAALVVSHEHFHSWNVKRIRPEVLGPFLYDREVHTRRLDVAEGFTEYYTFVAPLRSGFSSQQATWDVFADDITTEETSPGRKLFSLGDLSWNTWWGSDASYVPDGDYYDGAAVIAFMLDLKIRHDTNGAHSLDDVMRYLFDDWQSKALDQFRSPGGTYADDAMPSIIQKATGDAEAGALFHTWFDTTALPDWNTYLGYAGLHLARTMPRPSAATLDAEWRQVGAPTGVGFRPRGDHTDGLPTINPDEVMISSVMPGGAAERSGLEEYDVLLSLGGLAVTQADLTSILAAHHAGDRLAATVLRERSVIPLTITLGQDRTPTFAIAPVKNPTAAQLSLLKAYTQGIPFGK